ncbi:MAG: hypothetical protein KDA85_18745, partial [Planctomycetaceae bacterium]|nr:hypothetical protein [Planctomycetaceae bacterium]
MHSLFRESARSLGWAVAGFVITAVSLVAAFELPRLVLPTTRPHLPEIFDAVFKVTCQGVIYGFLASVMHRLLYHTQRYRFWLVCCLAAFLGFRGTVEILRPLVGPGG